MTFFNQLNSQEKRISIYLLIGAFFFLVFDYSVASFFDSINHQTKSLFGTLTHFGDSLYFFVPTIFDVPAIIPSCLSVVSLRTKTGLPKAGASSCNPPESVSTKKQFYQYHL